jgi:hypothetical protein
MSRQSRSIRWLSHLTMSSIPTWCARRGARNASEWSTARAALLLSALALVQGCTSMGHHDHALREARDFGPRDSMKVCLYLDRGIDETEARGLLERAWRTEADLYALDVEVAQVHPWRRRAFGMEGILADLRRLPLEAPCDRVLALVGRNLGDFLWSFVGPEVLGAVNDESLTHGYVVARRGSVNQVLVPPEEVARHEIYHLLGCGEHYDMPGCYAQIADLKASKRKSASDFFPAWDRIGKRMLQSRAEVNARIGEVGAAVAQTDGKDASGDSGM